MFSNFFSKFLPKIIGVSYTQVSPYSQENTIQLKRFSNLETKQSKLILFYYNQEVMWIDFKGVQLCNKLQMGETLWGEKYSFSPFRRDRDSWAKATFWLWDLSRRLSEGFGFESRWQNSKDILIYSDF